MKHGLSSMGIDAFITIIRYYRFWIKCISLLGIDIDLKYFHQDQPGNWDSAIKQIEKTLKTLI